MGYWEILLTGVALAMDAFAVSICKGIKMPRIRKSHIVIIAVFFGGFQMLMPLIGWLLGSQFVQYISKFDHWIAFALLAFIGVKMAIESFKHEEEDCCKCDSKLDLKELVVLAIATSIDALAVGITFALYPDINILPSISIIGIVTFVICAGGVVIGHKFGAKFKSKAELLGGIVLVIIGLKLLIEGLLEGIVK
ncbi:MAG: manganese efflux pump [Clostridia bacterium]|nr:manganese efflux pump [Clostridia bacterium]MBR2850541.1 manganese efflux pump [Clostridia bacterium]